MFDGREWTAFWLPGILPDEGESKENVGSAEEVFRKCLEPEILSYGPV